jgi:hypothetical protein
MEATVSNAAVRVPWNKDKLTGQKSPLSSNDAANESIIDLPPYQEPQGRTAAARSHKARLSPVWNYVRCSPRTRGWRGVFRIDARHWHSLFAGTFA